MRGRWSCSSWSASPTPRMRAKAFPHEFSGGMRQRVVIAMAIANDPALIICDEPTTALDVTVQAQILDLLRKARDITGAGVIMITHDMGIAATLADRVVVMYAGRIVESASAATSCSRAPGCLTPRACSARSPAWTPRPARRCSRSRAPRRAMHALPPGCPFAPRCPLVLDACRAAEPALTEVESGHRAACLRTGETSSADLFAAYRQALPEPAAAPAPDPEIVLRVRDLREDLSHHLRRGVQTSARGSPRGRRDFSSRCGAAARSPWSANPVLASRRP